MTGGAAFVAVELYGAREPMLAPTLLRQKIPVLVGLNNFVVAICNFTVQYFFPMWFQTVQLTTPAVAGDFFAYVGWAGCCSSEIFVGAHLMPNSVAMSCGSLFAGCASSNEHPIMIVLIISFVVG